MPVNCPSMVDPRESQLSSINHKLFSLAISATFFASNGLPSACAIIIALVLLEIAFFN